MRDHERRQVLGHLGGRGVGVADHRLGDEVVRQVVAVLAGQRVGVASDAVTDEVGEHVLGAGRASMVHT